MTFGTTEKVYVICSSKLLLTLNYKTITVLWFWSLKRLKHVEFLSRDFEHKKKNRRAQVLLDSLNSA